jgi:hypothetical protein
MLYTDFCQEFGGAVRKQDVPSAYASLMRELGRILVRDKQDFVDLLNESGYEAEIVDSDIDLVDTFVENVGNSPSLMLGASMLTAAHNRKMGFDGEDNYLDDELVKSSYRVMVDYNENYANAVGAIVAGALGATAAGVNLARTQKEAKRERESAGRKAYEQKEASKQQIVTGILEAKKQQQDALKSEQEREAKTRNILYIAGGAVVAIAVIGIVIYSIRKK